ncbi:MAG: hypothetical protein Q8L65_07895, partial [Burkholderiales bacterium]|nr:hypothetical protein [Burkholderiales bacterium]
TVAKEAHDQALRCLTDLLDVKKEFEKKAFFLFNAYVALALAGFGVGGTLLKEKVAGLQAYPFIFTGLIFVIGAGFFAKALLDDKYGTVGSNPEMWLNKGTIDGEDSVIPLMLAYITFHYKNRIEQSIFANNRKAKSIRIGILLGLATPVALALVFF